MILNSLFAKVLHAVEAGYIPDALVRVGIRRLLAQRLKQLNVGDAGDHDARIERFIAEASRGPVAPVPDEANRQHYELPAEFFQTVLGSHLKYSCCLWDDGITTLDEAEEAALRVTCERAGIADGMEILELGCGWGSLSLWMAEHFPNSNVTAVSNSKTQRHHIETQAARRGLDNLQVTTADMNDFDPAARYDRVVSVEMFEHMRNHGELLRRVAGWLRPGGRLFVHVFCHHQHAYPFESQSPQDWMAEHFFTGGMMPSDSLFAHYNRDLRIARQWRWNGGHYAKTCNAWLARMDSQIDEIRPIFASCYGKAEAWKWLQRWRLFFMACAELFAFGGGKEWYVSHCLFEPQPTSTRSEAITAKADGAPPDRRQSHLEPLPS